LKQTLKKGAVGCLHGGLIAPQVLKGVVFVKNDRLITQRRPLKGTELGVTGIAGTGTGAST